MEVKEKGIRKFSKEEKLMILEEAQSNSIQGTLSKYGLCPATFYYWRRKLTAHGADGLTHHASRNKEPAVRKLEKEIQSLRIRLAEKELESQLKDELLKKKVSGDEKKILIRKYMALGLTRNRCLEITGLTKHQFYHAGSGKQSGRFGSKTTRFKDPLTGCLSMVDNMVVVDKIVAIKLEPDLHHWYRMITRSLQLAGYFINHKKVYRLMSAYSLLEEPRKRVGRNFVTFGRMTPRGPLRSFEVEINYFWIQGAQKRASVLTILDALTRYALKWSVGYDMKAVQLKKAWEELIENFLQPAEIRDKVVEVIIGDANDRQFTTSILSELFRKNQINHLFTFHQSPKENGCTENFHSILDDALEKEVFTDLNSMEVRLQKFYANYNDHRCHSDMVGLPPSKFWALYELNKIEVIELSKGRIRFKLKVPYQDIVHLPEIGKYEHLQIPT